MRIVKKMWEERDSYSNRKWRLYYAPINDSGSFNINDGNTNENSIAFPYNVSYLIDSDIEEDLS